jgi:hypothetical protein
MQIQVRINEEGALRNQRYAFTDRFTLVTELLQNARRAGASRITIEYDDAAQLLNVSDDGCGIGDFQKLLSFHESGWDEVTAEQERPFGVGFSKCLYAASRCIVASGRQRVEFDTTVALALQPIDVVATDQEVIGTRVELYGVSLPDLASRIEALCQGFPVLVVFNGRALLRAYAIDRLATVATPIGAVYLARVSDGKAASCALVFLQGFCVHSPSYFRMGEVNVVHLDSREFMARLPDRDKLIDEDRQLRRVDAQIKASWRAVLEEAKQRLAADEFVETYFDAMRTIGHLDLMNDLDALPMQAFRIIDGYPIQEGFGESDCLGMVSSPPSRAAIESGAVTLVVLDAMHDENAAHWMLARAKGHLVFEAHALHGDHWVQAHARWLEEMKATVEAIDVEVCTPLEGRWVSPTVSLCRAVRIRVAEEEADVTDAGVCHEGIIYVPEGETSGEPVRQLSNFTDSNDQFQESDLESDREALGDLIRRLRTRDPVSTLDSLLHGLRLGKYPLLHGKTFELTVGVGASPGHSIVLADTVEAAGARLGVDHAGP